MLDGSENGSPVNSPPKGYDFFFFFWNLFFSGWVWTFFLLLWSNTDSHSPGSFCSQRPDLLSLAS